MKYSFFLLMFLVPFCSAATTITSNQSGNWHDSTTWDCGCFPTTTDTVVVNHQVTLASSIILSSLIIDASGELDATNLLTIVFVGDLSGNGEAVLPNVTLHAIGLEEMQTIEGNWSVRELIVTNGANLSLMGTLEVSTNVRVDQSTLSVEPEGGLLLTENEIGRATVIRSNAGHVNGRITRQINLPATTNRSMPFVQQRFSTGLEGVTVSELVGDIPTWGFQGADDPNGFGNIGYWSAEALYNYQTIQFATDTLPVWEGIYLSIPPAESYTITFSGTLPPEDISMSIPGDSFTPLFGNATNANADLQTLTSQFQGAPKALSCWNTNTLQYDLFIDGISTNGMNSTLQPNATCQFIPDSTDLTLMFENEDSMPNGAFASSLTPIESKAIFSVSNASGFLDEVVVTRNNNALDAYVSSEDALNTSSTFAACDLFLLDSLGNRTGISQIAFDSGELVSLELVMAANHPLDGNYELRCDQLDWCDGEVIFQSWNDDECILLSEGQFMDSIQLSSTQNHIFSIGTLVFAISSAQIPCDNLVDEFDSTCDCEGNVLDECGVCGGAGIEEGACDCEGNMLDAIGVCGGDCLIDQNCNGICDLDELENPSCGAECCGQGTKWDEGTQTCVVAFPADLNFDGCVQLTDLLDFLTAYGSCYE